MFTLFLNSKYVKFDTVSGALYQLKDHHALADMNMQMAMAMNADMEKVNGVEDWFRHFYQTNGRSEIDICDLNELAHMLGDVHLYDHVLVSLFVDREFVDTMLTEDTFLNLNFTFDGKIYFLAFEMYPIIRQMPFQDDGMASAMLLTSQLETSVSQYIEIASVDEK